MKLEKAVEEYKKRWTGGPSNTRLQGFIDGFNFRSEKRERSAAKRKAAEREYKIGLWRDIVQYSPYPEQVEDAKKALESEGIKV